MDRQKSLTKELALFKKRLSKKMPIDKMIFFGSRAIGKAKKYSDVDLIIVSKKNPVLLDIDTTEIIFCLPSVILSKDFVIISIALFFIFGNS